MNNTFASYITIAYIDIVTETLFWPIEGGWLYKYEDPLYQLSFMGLSESWLVKNVKKSYAMRRILLHEHHYHFNNFSQSPSIMHLF